MPGRLFGVSVDLFVMCATEREIMKAKIVNNLLSTINDYHDKKYEHRNENEFLSLCQRIQGQAVELIFVGKYAFEKLDNRYWLPDCCWKELET